MPLKKYNTAGSILGSSTTTTTNSNHMSPSPSISTSTSPSPPEMLKYLNNTQKNLATHMSSLVDAIENQAAISVSVSESSGSASDTITKSKQDYSHAPVQIKARLYALFCQIEHEFDLLYSENMRLKNKNADYSSNNEDDEKN